MEISTIVWLVIGSAASLAFSYMCIQIGISAKKFRKDTMDDLNNKLKQLDSVMQSVDNFGQSLVPLTEETKKQGPKIANTLGSVSDTTLGLMNSMNDILSIAVDVTSYVSSFRDQVSSFTQKRSTKK